MTALPAPDRRVTERRVSPAVGQWAILECARLREALQRIATGTVPALNGGTLYTDCQAFARAAISKAAS